MRVFPKLSIFIILILLLILSACGTSERTAGNSNGESKSSEDQKKTIRVVTDAAYAPFEYLEGDGVKGFDVDFVKAVAEEAGYEVKIEHAGWEPLFIEIENKKADFAVSAITINDDRKQTYDFSVPYFLSTNKILVSKDSDIKSGYDLKGKVVAVQKGTTGQETVEAILGKNNQDIRKYENNNLAIKELLSGGADAVVADNTVIEEYAKNNPERNLKVIGDESFAVEYYGLMFPKGSKLKVEIDKAINDIYDNGAFAEIYKEWFGIEADIKDLKKLQ